MKNSIYSKIARFISAIILLAAGALPAMSQPHLELTMEIPDNGGEPFLVGDIIPLTLTLHNISDIDVYITRPLDGSFYGVRYPEYMLINKPPVPLYNAQPFGLCGTLNPLLEEDFIKIPLGESYVLSNDYWFSYQPKMAGSHEISYSIDFNGPWDSYSWGYDTTPPELKTLWEMVPKEAVRSSTVTLEAVSNGKTLDPKYHCLLGMNFDEANRVFDYVYAIENRENVYRIDDLDYFGYPAFFIYIHFNTNNIIDGIELINNSNGTSLIELSHLLVLRGETKTIRERIEYENDTISAMQVGYFAPTSCVPAFQAYR